jgi:lactoylglutathione lyase
MDLAGDPTDAYWVWGTKADKPRLLHAMIRVRDLNVSLRFYVQGLGMSVLDRYDIEAGRFSIVFLSFAGYDEGPALELTHNWDRPEGYTHGSGYGHIAFGVPDIEGVYARLTAFGGRQLKPPKPQLPGGPLLAFVEDPDGYTIELIQTRR